MTYTNAQLALKLAVEAQPTRTPQSQASTANIYLSWLDEKTNGSNGIKGPTTPPRPAGYGTTGFPRL